MKNKKEKEIEKEVEKRLRDRVLSKTKRAGIKFKNEFKKHAITAITAAFAFLLALSWREPIQHSVNTVKEKAGLVGSEIYIEYLSAIIITVIAVLALIFISKWTSKD